MKKEPKQQYSSPSRKRRMTIDARKIIPITIIITFVIIAPFLGFIKPVLSITRNVPSPYPTIQGAVYAAIAGDTIQVAKGTYYEHVWINKTVTIIGENPQNTIVDGNGTGTPFFIEDAKNVVIRGFTIQNAGNNSSGIVSERTAITSDFNLIENNIIKTSLYAVYFSGSDSNKVYNNIITNNPLGGVFLFNSDSTNITGNTISGSVYGVKIINTSINTLVLNNTITETSNGIDITMSSTGTIIRRNKITGTSNSIYSSSDSTTIDHNTITNGSVGMYLYNSRLHTITYNTIIIPHGTGIKFYHTTPTSAQNTITNNKILDADWAIHLTNSNWNTFWGNWVQDNTYPFSLYSSAANKFYRNNFINNIQVYVAGTNTWDQTGNGNHWSGYTSPDADGNGIVDTSYFVAPNNTDNYPLKYTWSEHDIAVLSVTPSANQVNPGATVTITAKVKNIANISATATFTVTTKYNNTVISTQQVTNLAQGATSNLIFNWDTTGVAPGNYTIKAEATTVTDELNTGNNQLADGIVQIKTALIGDINGDGTINSADLAVLEQEYGLTPASPTWNPNCDLNHDNIVNEQDLYILAQNYGRTG